MNNNIKIIMDEYEKRDGQEEENKLFDLLVNALIRENNNDPKEWKMIDARERLDLVKEVLNNTDEGVINSNIYLRSCIDFLDEAEERGAETLVLHQIQNKNEIEELVEDRTLLREVDENTPLAKGYNALARELRSMYQEVSRLQLWNIIDKSELNKIDVNQVLVEQYDEDRIIVKTTFNTKLKKTQQAKKLTK